MSMSTYPSLESVVRNAVAQAHDRLMRTDCDFDGLGVEGIQQITTEVLTRLKRACTISTVAELDALPPDATVMSLVAIVAYQRARTPHSDWYSTGLSTIKSDDIPLPALLVWSPEWQKP